MKQLYSFVTFIEFSCVNRVRFCRRYNVECIISTTYASQPQRDGSTVQSSCDQADLTSRYKVMINDISRDFELHTSAENLESFY